MAFLNDWLNCFRCRRRTNNRYDPTSINANHANITPMARGKCPATLLPYKMCRPAMTTWLYGNASPIWKNPGWSSCGNEASEDACACIEG
jgi:hypothetical protein